MKAKITKISLALGVALLFVSASVPFVGAKSVQAVENGNSNVTTTNNADKPAQTAAGKLADAKLKACQNREQVMTNTMARITDRAQKQLAVFDKIAERVRTFYTEKGYQLANYDELVAEATAKRTAVQESIQTMTQARNGFSCTGEDPKGTINQYKESVQVKNGALKEYKTAIQNLIVAVKSVAVSQAEEQ